jgi:hypothetical protein
MDLVRIAINEADRGLGRDEDVTLVDVADRVATSMDGVKRDGTIHGGLNQEGPIGGRELFPAVRRAVKGMDLLVPRDPRHEDAAERSPWGLMERGRRPGCYVQQLRTNRGDHGPEFLLVAGVGRLVVELCHQGGLTGHLEDPALASDPQLRPEIDSVVRIVEKATWGHRAVVGWPG